MDFLKELFNRDIVKRVLSILILALAIYSMKSLMDLLLLTFLLTYLIYSFEGYLLIKIRFMLFITAMKTNLNLYNMRKQIKY